MANEKRPLPQNVVYSAKKDGLGVVRKPGDCLPLMPALDRVIADFQPDLIHAGPVPTCGFMTALSGFHPCLMMSWGSDLLVDADQAPDWRWAAFFALCHADAFQCDCQAVREKAQAIYPLGDDRILQFPWGIDLDLFCPVGPVTDLRKKLGWENNFVVLSNRSWEAIYGIETVLESFWMASQQDDSLRLLLLGGGSRSSWVHDYLRAHQLDKKVHLPGYIPNDQLALYLRATDLYLSCSYSDGTSVSLLEAMATGLPVLVSDISGNREWITSGENGWLATPEDQGQFADALGKLSLMPSGQRRSMADRNRTVVEKRADWSHNVSLLMEMYQKLCQCL